MTRSSSLTLRPSLLACAASVSAALILSGAEDARAGTIISDARFIRATVGTVCDISGSDSESLAAGQLDFGQRVLLEHNRKIVEASTTSMVIQCNALNTTVSVRFGPGNHADVASVRRLAGPLGALVPYYLYRDAAATIPWTSTAQSLTVPTTQAAIIPIFGRIMPVSQNAQEGDYTDSVQVTIEY